MNNSTEKLLSRVTELISTIAPNMLGVYDAGRKAGGTSDFIVTANITIGEDLFSGAFASVSNVSATYGQIKEAYESGENIILLASEDETTYIFELESVEIETFSFITLCKVTKGYAILNVKITADGENTTIVILKERNAVSQEVTHDVMTKYVGETIESEVGDINTALENIIALQDELLIPDGDEVEY